MCEPVSITAAVMAIAAAGSAYMQMDAQNKQAEATAEAANDAAQADFMALAERDVQIQDAAALERLERVRQGLRERAQLRVGAGEAGLSGNIAVREQAAAAADQGHDLSIIEANKSGSLRQNEREKAAVAAGERGRLNEARSRVSSGATAALQIGLAGVGGAAQGVATGSTIKSGMKKR